MAPTFKRTFSLRKQTLTDGQLPPSPRCVFPPQLKHHLAADFAVFNMLGSQIKPGGFDLSWMVADFQVSLTAELDFEGEAANSERCAADLSHRADVVVPRVIRKFTSKRVLTMEYVRGMTRCNDADELLAAGFSPRRVGACLAGVFAEMVFVHGHVHGDPHAGNVYVRPRPPAARGGGGGGGVGAKPPGGKPGPGGWDPQLVLLDHGLYHEVSDELRSDFCRLVTACVRRDADKTRHYSSRFAGAELHRFFPLILSPWFVFGARMTAADLRAAHQGALPPGVKLEDIGKFLVSLHDTGGTNMLGVLHSLGYTKGILNDIKFPEGLRLRAFAKYATLGLAARALRPGASPGAVVPAGSALLMAAALWTAALQVEALAWIITVFTPLAPLLVLTGSANATATLVAPSMYLLAALSVVFAYLTEHTEMAT